MARAPVEVDFGAAVVAGNAKPAGTSKVDVGGGGGGADVFFLCGAAVEAKDHKTNAATTNLMGHAALLALLPTSTESRCRNFIARTTADRAASAPTLVETTT